MKRCNPLFSLADELSYLLEFLRSQRFELLRLWQRLCFLSPPPTARCHEVQLCYTLLSYPESAIDYCKCDTASNIIQHKAILPAILVQWGRHKNLIWYHCNSHTHVSPSTKRGRYWSNIHTKNICNSGLSYTCIFIMSYGSICKSKICRI